MKQRRLILRRTAGISVLVLTATTLAACSAASGSDSGDGSSTTLTFAYGTADAKAHTWEDLAKEYTKETGVKVNVTALAADAYGPTLNTRLQAGNAPDLFLTQPGANSIGTGVTDLAKAGLLGEITGAAASTVDQSQISAYGSGGKVYGAPLYTTPISAIVNDISLKASGITWPETTSELLSTCKSLHAKGISFMTAAAGNTEWGPQLAGQLAVNDVYASNPNWNSDRAAGKVKFANSDWKKVLDSLQDMVKSNCFQAGASGANYDQYGKAMAGTDTKSLSIAGPANAWKDLEAADSKASISGYPWPADTADGRRLETSVGYTISYYAKSKSTKAAQAYIAWLFKAENLQKVADATGGLAPSGYDASTAPKAFEPMSTLLAAKQTVPSPYLTWPNGNVVTALGKGITGLFTGQKTPDQILADMDAAWGN